MADVEPIWTTCLSRLVLVSCEMHSVLTSRIDKNGVQTIPLWSGFSKFSLVDSHVSRRIPNICLKNRRTFAPFTMMIINVCGIHLIYVDGCLDSPA